MSISIRKKNTHPTDRHDSYPEKLMTEIIPNGFFVVDNKWIVKRWNKAAEDLLAIKSDDIVGRNLWKALAGIVPSQFYTAYHTAFTRAIPDHFVENLEEMGGWFDVVTCFFEGQLSVSFKSSRQLTHQKLPEAKLETLNELYRYVTEITNDCLWELHPSAKELYWIDGGHKRVFGYPIVNGIIPQEF
ncbi:MAG TPA: PAS domain-containing protein, partial [Flavisolibacter sp.]|nr:PAS domain-containing protein [Flavisolibacter sp.]